MTTPVSGQAPLVATRSANVAALGATADASPVVCEAPFAGSVSRVGYVPVSAITGANTNTRTLTVTNRGQDGTGTTNVATLALTSGVNAAADDEKAITLSGTAGHLTVAAGDVLTFDSTHASSGLADPGGSVVIEFTRG